MMQFDRPPHVTSRGFPVSRFVNHLTRLHTPPIGVAPMPHPTPEVPGDAPQFAGRVRVALRIVGDEVDPGEITARLGLIPTFAARKGDEVWSRGQSLRERTGVWSYALIEEADTGDELDDAIAVLLSRFPTDPELWRSLGERHDLGVSCSLYVSGDGQGTDLAPATLAALASRGLTLSLDVFTPAA